MNDKVYVSVELVEASNQGTVLLGVSLMVLPGSLPIGDSLKPWHWTIQGWVVAASQDGTSWVNPSGSSSYKHLDLPREDNEPGRWSAVLTSMKNAFDDAIGKINKGPKGLPAGDPLQSITIGDAESTPAAHRYLTLLANASAGPYPLPQNLNLSFFLEIPNASQYNQFLVLPIFTAGGATYDASGQPLPTSAAWDVTVSGFDLHAQFSKPDAATEIPASLWLPPVSGGSSPLVTDWSAHIYELIAPYLDLPILLSNLDYATLSKVLPDKSTIWPIFRSWVVRSLQELVSAAQPPANEPGISAWCSTLRLQLGRGFAQFPALNPDDQSARNLVDEMADIRKIVSAATSGTNLPALVQSTLPANASVVPARLLTGEASSQLLSWLEIQLAIPYSKPIAAACGNTPTDFKAIAAELCTKVISSQLLHRASRGQDPFSVGGVVPVWAQQLSSAIISNIQQPFFEALSRRALGTSDPTSYPATTVAPPMVVPVFQLRTSGGPNSDPLHGVRGVALLIRRVEKQPMDWSCPSVVAPDGNSKLPLLIASRLGYNQNLLTAFLLYNNGPLPCENLLHNYMESADRLSSGMGSSSVDDIAAILRYVPYEGLTAGLYGTPMLEAGAVYEVACFAISNSGALPKDLRGAYPAKFKPLSGRVVPGASTGMPSGVVQKIGYFRTVPVCAPELRNERGKPIGTNGLFPKIPQRVWPKAVDTIVPRGGVGLSVPAAGSTPANPPTLLVVPSKSQTRANASGTVSTFSFSLKLPSVEPQTWDRTVGYRLPTKAMRAEIVDNSYLNLARKQPSEIFDPLVAGITLSLYRWNTTTGSWDQALGSVSYRTDELQKAKTGLDSVKTDLVYVSVNAGTGSDDGSVQTAILVESTGEMNTNSSAKSLANKLAEGEVYLLEVTLLLDKVALPKIMPRYPRVTELGYQLLIEIASAKMPSDLMHPFTVMPLPVDGIPDQKMRVQLQADSTTEWRNIHRVDILRQSWRWTGRTQPEIKDATDLERNLIPGYYPAASLVDSVAVREWEKIEFSERSSADRVEFTSVQKANTFSWDQDVSHDPRASFYRFAPRVYSRYEGAFSAGEWSVATTVGDSEKDDSWRRCFLRSRAQKLTMPRLKAVIPMTESAFAAGTPGILAVFDGPAYEQAGLAERLAVSVAKVKDPDLSIKKDWNQSGPDFLMSSETVDPDPDKQVLLKLVPIGPIGHTLDSLDSGFPKFNSNSWIIRPVDPKNSEKPDPAHDFSWWFANLEFNLIADSDSSVFKKTLIQSQSTVGSWIQFLPGFQDGSHQSDDFIDWSIQYKSGVITVTNEKGVPVTRGSGGERHTRHYLLVTRTVFDITGKAREAYVGVAEYKDSKWSLFPDVASSVRDGADLHARFLDVRAGEIKSSHEAPPTSDVEFWKRIFGRKDDGVTDESRASIISLSPAIHGRSSSQ